MAKNITLRHYRGGGWAWLIKEDDFNTESGWAISRRGAIRNARRSHKYWLRRQNPIIEEVSIG